MVYSESVLRLRDYLVLLQNCCRFMKKKRKMTIEGQFVLPKSVLQHCAQVQWLGKDIDFDDDDDDDDDNKCCRSKSYWC